VSERVKAIILFPPGYDSFPSAYVPMHLIIIMFNHDPVPRMYMLLFPAASAPVPSRIFS
jgi:hypothetical protein